MNKVAVLVCSNAGLDYLDYPKDIRILRSVIHFKDDEKAYNDFIDMDAATFYDRITKDPNDIPKTSYVSMGKMIETFHELTEEGYEEAIVITISSALSGLYDAVKKVAQEEEVKLKIHAFDSRILAYSEAFMALEAHRLLKEGKSVQETLAYLEKLRNQDNLYFAVDTLLYLVKNGRLSKLQGTLGTMLKLKPLLQIGDNGKVETIEKIRTTAKALDRVLEKYFEETKNLDVITYISHAHNESAASFLKNRIQKEYPTREVVIAYLTPVVGAHTGPRGIGIGYINMKDLR
ncbi:MAG: DegV family protein [Acholeplasmataceae bacterium]